MANNSKVITLRVEVLNCLSRKKIIEVDLDLGDRPVFPIPRDSIQIDRSEVRVVSAPASDDDLLDGKWDGAGYWQCVYEGDWVKSEALAASLKEDPGVRGVRVTS